MIQYGEEFIYNGKSSDTYDLMLCDFNAGGRDVDSHLRKDVTMTKLSKERTKVSFTNSEYSDCVGFPINIVHKDGSFFDETQIRQINNWLLGEEVPKKFISRDNSSEHIEFYGIFTDVNYKILGGKIYAMEYTFQSNAPYGFSSERIYQYNSSETDDENIIEILFNNDSDEKNKFLYPIIEITPSNTGIINLKNITDNNNSIDVNVTKDKILRIDCQNGIVLEDNEIKSFSDLGWNKYIETDFNNVSTGECYIYWLRLLKGINKLVFTGDVEFSIKIKCQFIRKCGVAN